MIELDIANMLKEKRNIAIVSHVMPDGDNIGSMLALYNILKRMGKYVYVYSSDPAPEAYSFLPGYKDIKRKYDDKIKKYDVVIILDCGSIDRTGDFQTLRYMTDTIINIDHHGTNSAFGNVNFVDTHASATGELIYRIIKEMKVGILKDEACCLYTAILTDTGGFRYSNTTPQTHRIVGELISYGIDFGSIYAQIYNNYRYEDIKFLGKAINSIELFCDGKIAFMKLLKEDFGQYSVDQIDTNDFINYARDIKSVEAAAFVKEISENEYKISLRSKNIVDVKAICEKFGGGGHLRAAGCSIRGDFNSVKNTVIKELENALKGESI